MMTLHGKRIFIVEDNFQNRVVFLTTLKMQGAWVEFDRWGTDALWRLRAFRQVDLIILDLMLTAGISGYDIFDQIRSLPEYNRTPIVAVSAAEPAVAIPKTQAKGFAGFITKPIDDERFPQQLARIIAGEQVWYAGERYQGIC
ncbi:MAG: response regulator [Chloroflexi bacterium]|nr:response regulator [Chloroflexota bacterium]